MNKGNGPRTRGILFKLMLIISIVVVVTSLIFTILLVEYRTKDLIEREDSRLLIAAELSRQMIGPGYHDKISDSSSVSREEFQHIVSRNDELCRRLNLQYLWSVLLVEGHLVFTSATHSDLQDPNSPCASFFEIHRDPEAFSAVMKPELKPSYSSFKNEWGEGRMVLIPWQDAWGRTYIFGASVQLKGLNAMVRTTIVQFVGIGMGIFSGAFILALLLARSFTVPITRLIEAAGRMATGEFNVPLVSVGTRELQSLSNSLDHMRQGLIGHLEALRESEEKFRLAFENANTGMCLVDLQGRLLEVNDKMSAIFGYSKNELEGMSVNDLAVPEDVGVSSQFIHRAIQGTEHSVVFEKRYRHRQGHMLYGQVASSLVHDAHGQPLYFISQVEDLTERKRAEEERNLALNMSYDLICIAGMDGYFKYVNPAWERTLGYTTEELLSRPFLDFIHPEDHQKNDAEVAKLALGMLTVDFENRYLHKDGSIRTISWTASPLPEKSQMHCVGRDITERKKAGELQRQLDQQHQQTLKAESLNRMAGAIAHHFNNQLGTAMGNLELAMIDLPKGARPHANITEAMKACQRAADVSGQMLTYLGQTHGKRESLDLPETCLRNLSMLRAVMPKNVVVETELPSLGPTIAANSSQLQQVLTNLITNAWEACGEDSGSIHLTVKTVSSADIPATHRFPPDWQPQDKAYSCLEVADTGCGIEDKDIEKIFDPFFSSKFTGRGLGLSTVLGIVRTQGGVITVESEVDRGSVFRIFFPMAGEEVARQQEQAVEAPQMEGGGTVLLVEDEEMMRKMVETLLTHLGFTVLAAKDGVEAVEVFRKHRDEIRCVLCDLTMPRMNGWETLAALRALRPDVPVVLASGYDEAKVMQGDHPELPQAFLHKPYRMAELKAALAVSMGASSAERMSSD